MAPNGLVAGSAGSRWNRLGLCLAPKRSSRFDQGESGSRASAGSGRPCLSKPAMPWPCHARHAAGKAAAPQARRGGRPRDFACAVWRHSRSRCRSSACRRGRVGEDDTRAMYGAAAWPRGLADAPGAHAQRDARGVAPAPSGMIWIKMRGTRPRKHGASTWRECVAHRRARDAPSVAWLVVCRLGADRRLAMSKACNDVNASHRCLGGTSRACTGMGRITGEYA